MSLQPVEGLLEVVSRIEEENPEAARELVRLGLYESMTEQIDKAWPEMQVGVLTRMQDVAASARSSMLRSHVGKALDGQPEPQDQPYAEGLAMLDAYFSKGILSGALLSLFNRRHKRDDKGRFVRADVGQRTDPNQSLATRQMGHHQEALEAVDAWAKDGLIDDNTPLTTHHRRVDVDGRPLGTTELRNPATKANLQQRLGGIQMEGNDHLLLTGITVDTHKLKGQSPKQRAAMDLMATLTDNDHIASRRLLRGLPMDAEGNTKDQTSNASRWHGESVGTDRRAYNRMSMTGDLLTNISAPGSTINTVGGLAQLIGNLGPEAEKVLGPGIRRTAYRYRGTERRPDRQLVTQVKDATKMADTLDTDNLEQFQQAQREVARQATAERASNDPAKVVAGYWMAQGQRVTPDERALGMRGDAAVATLLSDPNLLPSQELTELSVESGELPPSQGVIIDARGEVVSQAQGYNGDHYLPFDLRNLNALHGGQYVRTRATGGPTTEDIYTGLLTGARQIQVVSNSGVFTLEFDPDLRGGRRYTDKAQRMVGRYSKLLATIAGGGLYQTDLTPAQRADIRTKAWEGAGGDKDRYEANLKTLTDRARLESSVGAVSDEEMEEAANNAAASEVRRQSADRAQAGNPMSNQERARVAEEAKRTFRAKQAAEGVRRLRLDGPGYDRALKTLRQEFPYFIRKTSWKSLPDWLAERKLPNPDGHKPFAPTDSGYVRPGQTNARPTSAQLVPTGRFREGAAAPTAAPAAPGAAPAAGAAPAGQREFVNPITGRRTLVPAPAAAPAATAGGGAPKTRAQATGPGTPFMNEVAKAVNDSLHAFNSISPLHPLLPSTSDEDALATAQPEEYAHYKWRAVTRGSSNPAEKFATWLVKDATPPQRNMVMESLEHIPDVVAGVEEAYQRAYPDDKVIAAGDRLKELVNLAHPFDEPADDPALAISGDDKPQPFEGIPDSVDPADFDHFLAQAAIDTPEFANAVREFEGATPGDMSESVKDAVQEFQREGKNELQAKALIKQTAWSFVTARDVARKLREMGGGGAGPKDVAKGSRRRKLIVHKVDDSFSKQLHRALGGL
jgi:hypothetical protein